MTDLLYLRDANLTECECRVAGKMTIDGKEAVVLNRSPFYPKGGGQPADIGFIIGASGPVLAPCLKSQICRAM